MTGNRVPQFRKQDISWEESLQQFLWFKQAQGLRESTVNDYRRFAKQFFGLYPGSFEDPQKLKLASLEYLANAKKPSTYNLRLTYLRGFFEWCVSDGVLTEDPMVSFKVRSTSGRIVEVDTEILIRLLSLPDKSTFVGIRDYALIILTLDTGIRPKEAFSLLMPDVNPRSLEISIRPEASKTKTPRTLPILPPTSAAISELIRARHPLWPDIVFLFCTRDGEPMTKDVWGKRMRGYADALGVKVRPYDLRHSFALMYLRQGGNAFGLQRMMGHTTMEMTRRYVNLTGQDLKDQHSIASPLRSLLPNRQRVRRLPVRPREGLMNIQSGRNLQ